MVSFYPGPSRVHDEVPRWTAEAAKKGILSMNHRSMEFMHLAEDTVLRLRQKLNVPRTYTVFFVSSATECWEIIAQSFVQRRSVHCYNGAFGEKWYQYTNKLRPGAQALRFNLQQPLDVEDLVLDRDDVLCITQNETSNGSSVAPSTLHAIRTKYRAPLIAVDATSSMAGIELNFTKADLWFASVQKCFGLPAGLALLICSPRSLERAEAIGERDHYNSVLFMREMMRSWQTTHTPNVLGIYLLNRALHKMRVIAETGAITKERAKAWFNFVESLPALQPLIANKNVRSSTVITLSCETTYLEKLKAAAKRKGFLLGNGYGEYKTTTLRIANFPVITDREINSLKRFLKGFKA